METVESQLQDALARVNPKVTNRSFATRGIVSPLLLPLAEVEGVGTLGLPVCQEQAARLLEAGAPAPHGRGEATVVDPSVRDCRRFGPEKVGFKNPKWEAAVRTCCEEARRGLGVVQTVRAEVGIPIL